jgi:hypothetical protein
MDTIPKTGGHFTGPVYGYSNVPTHDDELVTKEYVDNVVIEAGGYTDEQAQDAVGEILTDSSEINFTYNDAENTITAVIINNSIDETKLDASVNASLYLADSALQSDDIDESVQAYSEVLQNTTASYTVEEKEKLLGLSLTSDSFTNAISDINSATYYYYGGNTGDDWKINRILKSNVNTKTSALQDDNPSYTTLSAAWAARTSLSYS